MDKGVVAGKVADTICEGFVTNQRAAFHRGAPVSRSKFSFPSPTHIHCGHSLNSPRRIEKSQLG